MADRAQQLRLLEAILFASAEPVGAPELHARLPAADLSDLIGELVGQYAHRGVNLVERDGRWAFRTAPDLAAKLSDLSVQPTRVSRAAVETLAIIAYHQPVTRSEIEAIRGVATSKGTLDQLIEAGWVRPGKRKEIPGRPLTWVTTPEFLDHFGLTNLAALPSREELKAAGLLDARPAITVAPEHHERGDDDQA